jgi:acyl-coenzyme A synthetase/AMP-(fatty) acid ligase
MLPFSPSFVLHETQSVASLYAITEAIAQASAARAWDDNLNYLTLNYPTTPEQQDEIVGLLIQAIFYCSAKNIPLLLNRTGDDVDPILSAEATGQINQKGFTLGLQTSGTTGQPKWVFSSFETLLPRLQLNASSVLKNRSHVWLLCYHPFSFAGIQVILQALIGGNTLCAFPQSSVDQLAKHALDANVSALSCTPSLFRSLNLVWGANKPALKRLSLGGEIATQSILDDAKGSFPEASLRHIYATTETGVVFSIKDGLSGFPESWLEHKHNGWALSLESQQLTLSKPHLRVQSGDNISVSNGRCEFVGRSDNIINIGGAKVDALALENAILELEAVIDARVFAKPNPIVGNVVGVEIRSSDKAVSELALAQLKKQLPSIQQPRLIKWVNQISLSDTGKKLRNMP